MLRDQLPGISPTLLTEQLQALAAHGLVATRQLPPPAARTVYTATAKAREAVPIIQAMARFGMELLPPTRAATKLRPEAAAYGAVSAWYDSRAAESVDEVYRLVVDGAEFTLASAPWLRKTNSLPKVGVLVGAARRRVIGANAIPTQMGEWRWLWSAERGGTGYAVSA